MTGQRPLPRSDGFPGDRHQVLDGATRARALRHRLSRDLMPVAVGHFPRAAGHLVRRADGLGEAILILCVEGEGWARFDRRHWRLRAGDAMIVPAGVPHAYGASRRRPWSIYWVHVCGRNAADYLRATGATRANPVWPSGALRELGLDFERLIVRFHAGATDANLAAMSGGLAVLLSDLALQRQPARSEARDSIERVRRSADFMRDHLAERLPLRTFAQAAGLSVPHYAALFRSVHGCAPLAFFLRLKVAEACRALATTDEPVRAIAARLGFDDSLYFSRLFRKVQGVPPSAYRDGFRVTGGRSSGIMAR